MADFDETHPWQPPSEKLEDTLRREREDAREKALLESRLEAGAEKIELLAAEFAPIKKLYYATLGCGFVGAALVALMIWVYTNDRADTKADRLEFKSLAMSVYEIASVNKVLLEKQTRLQAEQDRLWLLMGSKR